MPRVQKRIPRKTFKRKCHHCGKMKTNPYVYHIVPSVSSYAQPPMYQKGGTKIDREDLKGDMKVTVRNFCDSECKTKYARRRWSF